MGKNNAVETTQEISTGTVEKREKKEKQIVYIGKSISTTELQLQQYVVLFGYPLNFEELKGKYKGLEELFVELDKFVEIRNEIAKGSLYYKNLIDSIYKDMTGGR